MVRGGELEGVGGGRGLKAVGGALGRGSGWRRCMPPLRALFAARLFVLFGALKSGLSEEYSGSALVVPAYARRRILRRKACP